MVASLVLVDVSKMNGAVPLARPRRMRSTSGCTKCVVSVRLTPCGAYPVLCRAQVRRELCAGALKRMPHSAAAGLTSASRARTYRAVQSVKSTSQFAA